MLEFTNTVFNDIIKSSNRDEIYNINLYFYDFGENSETLGSATTSTGTIRLNKNYDSTITLNDQSQHGYITILLHEVLHIFGLINTTPESRKYNIVNYQSGASPYNSNKPDNVYYGPKGVAGYKQVLNANNISTDSLSDYVPIENNFGSGTKFYHFEEGIKEGNNDNYSLETRRIDGVEYPSVVNELMTGFLDTDNFITPMTLGCLEDIGFNVNYDSEYVVTTSTSNPSKLIIQKQEL